MSAIFIYSTGRCGTQWFTKSFADNLGSGAEVVHEPLGAKWAPRLALRHHDLALLRRSLPEVDRHLDRIAETVAAGRTYVETGWPAFAWYPYLRSILGERFRWIHVVRNPIYVAASLITLRCYDPDITRVDREFAELALLHPTDRGVIFKDFAKHWPSLTQFEKCLFQWLEINRYGIELAKTHGLDPVSIFRFEDVFARNSRAIRQLYRAAGLGEPTALDMKPVDRFQVRAPLRPEVNSYLLWREVEALARQFGYDPEQLQLETKGETILHRYTWDGRGSRGFKKARRLVKASMIEMFGRHLIGNGTANADSHLVGISNQSAVAIERRSSRRRFGLFGRQAEATPAKEFPDINEPDFVAACAACRPATMTSVERLYALYHSLRYVVRSGLPGAFIECGVWKGGSAMMMALTLKNMGITDRDIVLFDTFQGMTPPGREDVDREGVPASALLSRGDRNSNLFWAYSPIDEVARNLRSTGYPMERIHLIAGDVMQTIPAQAPESIALLRLDTDWYESTRHELEHLFPRLSPRGVLIIDDYGHFKGARKAVDEYFASNPVPYFLQRVDYTGRVLTKT